MIPFATVDLLVIVFYFLLVLVVGIYAARRKEENSASYFLAGNKMGWFAIGASLFVTNISAEHFIGLAGSGAENGLIVGHFEWMAVFAILLLGWVFAPLYLKAGVYTVPEFLEKRFNRASRIYLTSVSIVAYILTKISVTLFAGGLIMHALLGWDIFTSAVVMVVITGIYTVVGGLGAVMYTHVLQIFFMVIGAGVVMFFGLNEVGGFQGLWNKLPESYFDIFRPVSDPDFPWTGLIFGAPILAVWYWCTDQYIVQRVLGARNVGQVKRAALFTSGLKFLPVFLFIIPGMVTAVLYPGVTGDDVYPLLLTGNILPAGLYGLFIAGLLAAIMSSLASVFNSTATLYTMDFYRNAHPDASQRKLVLVGRLTTTVLVISAILWIPVTKIINAHIYIYLQSVQAYISPPIAAVFLIGVMSKRVNGRGAIWALTIGGILGGTRLILELLQKAYSWQNPLLEAFVSFNFLHFAIFLFIISTGILFALSRAPEASFSSVPAQASLTSQSMGIKMKEHV